VSKEADGEGCQVVTDWHCTPEGDRGDEIECGAPARWQVGDVRLCEECAAAMRDNGDFTDDELTELLPKGGDK
jgi:hypothetical protein